MRIEWVTNGAGGTRYVAVDPGLRLRDNQWEIESATPLGRGSFGVVYKARWVSESIPPHETGRDHGRHLTAAIKMLVMAAHDKAVADEILHTSRVHHPNVVELLDRWAITGVKPEGQEPADVVCLAFELCDGGSLGEQRLTEPQAVQLFDQVLAGLEAIHGAGLVHSDIKPENILRSGDTWKIADLGVATATRGRDHGTVRGFTAPYVPPEDRAGVAIGVGARQDWDIWALGVTVHESVGGNRDFPTDGLEKLTPELRDRIAKCLHDTRGHRPANASELRKRLTSTTLAEPPGPIPNGPPPGQIPAASPPRRWPAVVGALVLVAAVAAGGSGFLASQDRQPSSTTIAATPTVPPTSDEVGPSSSGASTTTSSPTDTSAPPAELGTVPTGWVWYSTGKQLIGQDTDGKPTTIALNEPVDGLAALADGSFVVSAGATGSRRLQRVRMDGDKPTTSDITRPAIDAADPSAASASTLYATANLNGNRDIVSVNLATSAIEPVTTTSTDESVPVANAGDPSSLVYRSREGTNDVVVVSVPGQADQVITAAVAGSERIGGGAVAPNGTDVAIAGRRGGNWGVVLLKLDEDNDPAVVGFIKSGVGTVRDIRWGPDGVAIAWIAAESGSQRVLLSPNGDGAKATAIASASTISGLDWLGGKNP